MPTAPTYPGVYIEEIPSGVRTIVGVATSITAFIGIASRGQTNKPVRIQSFADFDRQFGGLWVKSTMSYAVQQYFLNGGTDAIIIRVVASDATKATATVGGLELEANSQGDWMNGLKAVVNYETRPQRPNEAPLFNLKIQQVQDADGQPLNQPAVLEEFRNISADEDSPRFVTTVLEQESALVSVANNPSERPSVGDASFSGGANGSLPTYGDYTGEESDPDDPNSGPSTGIYALDAADIFNILCIPPITRDPGDSVDAVTTLFPAAQYCKKRRAMLIVDPPANWKTIGAAKDGVNDLRSALGNAFATNAAAYFPRLKMPDPLKENRIQEFVPCGIIAGIFARTDAQRGIWKAPAGIEASVSGVRQLAYKMTDLENGILNPLGLNCIRSFPVYGNVVWGARTLAGADQLASEWKYVPVRRLALFMEESLYRGTQWVVFEPNDEPLWAQIRLNIGAFMNNLFRQGAFQGSSPKEAYFVKCDKDTTTQNDIDRGIVNIIVGYAPLKPAEFVIIKFQQIAGNIAT
ncbi:phage tail sheath protein FI [Rivularia sp. PCC 7116]|uniref:phage tail sheath family protein n=1 Tax=Rivularia sp. PCC 7116 TaxID=373994 RepID=UPI00029F2C47|nr:phage tail sheath C-terminal domain-containing protein [Rivularia sp. PCC 7116]AFY57580.1 phage tail sheath protein FI [Rivularia sp. PCC 7116]